MKEGIIIQCPICNSTLYQDTNKRKCKTESCLYNIDDLANSGFWHEEAFEKLPSILAHEYRRVFDLAKKDQLYGVLLQLKDLFEVIIKFPILIGISEIYNREERNDGENKVLIDLLSKPLALGAWKSIGDSLKKLPINQAIKELLHYCLDLFDGNDLVHWRNENIGHGALSFDDDSEFIEDLKKKIVILKNFFESNFERFTQIRLVVFNHTQEKQLTGFSLARELEMGDSELKVYINEDTIYLSPFILIDSQGIFFFDSYYSKYSNTGIINYPIGRRKLINESTIFSLNSTLNNQLSRLQKDTSIEDYVTSLEMEILEKIQEIDDFQRPNFLVDWLDNLIKKEDKGIFLLQMERGTGKSTFSRYLDELTMTKEQCKQLKHVSVRVNYLSNSQRYQTDDFIEDVNQILFKGKKLSFRASNIKKLTIDSTTKSEDFANLLNKVLSPHQKEFEKEKLLFIIDGLDEISEEGLQIFDFIPKRSMLEKGVYILLTCRTKMELKSPMVKDKIESLLVTKSLCIKKDNPELLKCVRGYIAKNIFKIQDEKKLNKTQEQEINSLINKTEGRFLYLKAIKEMFSKENFSAIPSMDTLFDYYLDKIKFLYGEKHYETFVDLLSIISSSFEPLTLSEISYLFNEPQISYKLIGHLIDLRGFLKIERSYRGNIYSISHEEWQNIISSRFAERIDEMVNEWNKNILSIKEIDFESFQKNDGFSYLYSNILGYNNKYKIKNTEKETEKQFIVDSKNFINQTIDNVPEYILRRLLKLYNSYLSILKEKSVDDKKITAKILMDRSFLQKSLNYMSESLESIEEAYFLIKSLCDEDPNNEETLLQYLATSEQLVLVYLNLWQYTTAKGICLSVMALLENKYENYLAQHLKFINFYGVCLENLTFKGSEAVTVYLKTVVNKYKSIFVDSFKTTNNDISFYLQKGTIFLKIEKLRKALKQFDFIIKNCMKNGDIHNPQLSIAFISRAETYDKLYFDCLYHGKIEQADEALEKRNTDVKDAIEIFISREEKHLAINKNDYASILYRAFKLNGNTSYLNNSIKIFEELFNSGDLQNIGVFQLTYCSRGMFLIHKGEYSKGIKDLTKSIELCNLDVNLNKDDPIFYNRYLCVMERFRAYIKAGDIDAAFRDQEDLLSMLDWFFHDFEYGLDYRSYYTEQNKVLCEFFKYEVVEKYLQWLYKNLKPLENYITPDQFTFDDTKIKTLLDRFEFFTKESKLTYLKESYLAKGINQNISALSKDIRNIIGKYKKSLNDLCKSVSMYDDFDETLFFPKGDSLSLHLNDRGFILRSLIYLDEKVIKTQFGSVNSIKSGIEISIGFSEKSYMGVKTISFVTENEEYFLDLINGNLTSEIVDGKNINLLSLDSWFCKQLMNQLEKIVKSNNIYLKIETDEGILKEYKLSITDIQSIQLCLKVLRQINFNKDLFLVTITKTR